MFILFCVVVLADIDMKKDIATLIAEERADIILKYDQVGSGSSSLLCSQVLHTGEVVCVARYCIQVRLSV